MMAFYSRFPKCVLSVHSSGRSRPMFIRAPTDLVAAYPFVAPLAPGLPRTLGLLLQLAPGGSSLHPSLG